jgi:hypothetical protein
MKKLWLIRISLMLLIGGTVLVQQKATASPNFGVSFQVFYNELAPYGDWVMDPNHGYVWIPFVDRGFHPYSTNGYWEMTNFGNTWVSNYAWGWAPFHYGRWYWTNFYGWAWVPGYEWGPAWVSWRSGGGYYGWAPLAPGFGFHVGMNMPSAYYVFVPQRRFRDRHFHRYYVHHRNVVHVYNQTTIINNNYTYNNRTYISGPDRRDIERVTRSRVPVYQVADTSRPGRAAVRNNSLELYRPEVTPSRSNQERPSRAYTADEYRQRSASESRTASAQRGAVQPTQSRNSGSVNSQQGQPSRQSSSGMQSPSVNRGQDQNSGRAATQSNPRTETPSRQGYENGSSRANNGSVTNQPVQPQRNTAPQPSRSEVKNERATVPAQAQPRNSAPAPNRGSATAPAQTEVRQNRSSQPSQSRVSPRSESNKSESTTQGRSGTSSRSAGSGRGNN